jgi:superfamily II DNA/RNA helicase
LDKNVPEMKVAVAHGQMPPTVIEDIMSAFYDGKYDVLLSTTIIESGLDIPNANTLIVHRADMFGLAQLYQLRGRVGRSKLRAYALFTLPAQQKITAQAERRLKVLQSLETSARASSWPRTTSISAAPAICSARSSPATSRKSASSFISRCWRRRSQPQGRRRRARRRSLVAADHHRHAGADPGGLSSATSRCGCRCTGGSPTRYRRGDRQFRRRNARPLWRAAGRGALSVQGRSHQGYCRRANVEKVDAGRRAR